MLGKKLHSLLVNLDNSERRTLLNRCKRAGDKRFAYLERLARKCPKDIEQFQVRLLEIQELLYGPDTGLKEAALSLRRLIDFCIHEVENLKIMSCLGSTPALRSLVLSQALDHSGMRHVQERYLLDLESYSGDDYLFWEYAFSRLMRLTLVSQTRNAVDEWRDMLLKKKAMLHAYYQRNMAQLYDMASSSYFDDRSTQKLLEKLDTNQEEMEIQARISEGYPEAALLKLSQARFRFLDREACEQLITEATGMIHPFEGKDADLIRRKIAFARFMFDFHYGAPLDACQQSIQDVLSWSRKYEIDDPKSWLYLLIITALKGSDLPGARRIGQHLRQSGAHSESAYMADFGDALIQFVSGNHSTSRRLLSGLAYGPNPYISIWSRLLEMILCYQAGDMDLLESLANRTSRLLHQNASRTFTIAANMFIYCRILETAGIPIPPRIRKASGSSVPLSRLHRMMLGQIGK